MNAAERLVSNPLGAFATLALAAWLEAFGDSFFQVGLHRSSGIARVSACMAGVAVLGLYGVLVNVPRWDFGRLLGVYVALFFLMAQILNKVRFGQWPAPPVCVGGALIVSGALVIAFWKG
jgi:drug/metabolite transporter superfamily protein YnfA